MAKTTTVKSSPVTPPATPIANTNVTASSPTVITVVVVDDKSQPLAGARVSITPSDASTVTNGAGEAQFTLGSAIKYNITATAGSNTVTVPYYVTQNGATRLVVNPKYVKTIEAQLHPSSFFGTGFFVTSSSVLVIVIALVVFWKFFLHKYRRVS